jgi:hypothetical protein
MKIIRYKSLQDDYEGEEWKQYLDFNNYLISNFGRIKNKLTNRIKYRAEKPGCKSYKQTTMLKDGISHRFFMHVLVLLTFVGKRPKGLVACHNNGNLRDNRLENLRWATPKENVKDAVEHGTFKLGIHNRSKISESDVIAIRSYKHHLRLNKKLSEYYGVSIGVIYDIRARRTWKHI